MIRDVVDFSVQEVRRYFIFIFKESIQLTKEFLYRSSMWRRRHQFIAKQCHYAAQENYYCSISNFCAKMVKSMSVLFIRDERFQSRRVTTWELIRDPGITHPTFPRSVHSIPYNFFAVGPNSVIILRRKLVIFIIISLSNILISDWL